MGSQLPPLEPDAAKVLAHERAVRFWRRVALITPLVLVLLVVVGGSVQWLRPLPDPTLQSATGDTVLLPGAHPALPWPTTGSAAVDVEGVGSLGQVHGSKPVPVAGVATALTAYVVLKDHPLAPGKSGPDIPVTAPTLAAYQSGSAAQVSEVAVAQGETLTELQALEGMLVAGGSDMATMLAVWDAGSVQAFLSKADLAAIALGMRSTHVTDPSGLDRSTMSTPSDLVRLGEAAMAIPTFKQIVSLGEVNLPMAGLIYNLNFDLGVDGIIGLKTGSDAAANGCYLFVAQQTVGGRPLTVVGAVLGQQGTSANTAAVDAGDQLVKAAFGSLGPLPLLPVGHVVGKLEAPWGASTPVVVSTTGDVVGWPGLEVPTRFLLDSHKAPVPAGSVVGQLVVRQNGVPVTLDLRTTAPLSGPSAFWRLTRV